MQKTALPSKKIPRNCLFHFSLRSGWREERFRRRVGGILLILSPLILTFCCQLITLRSLQETVLWFGSHPGPVFSPRAFFFWRSLPFCWPLAARSGRY